MNLPADEVLMCGCGRELAVIEIAGRPTLAHKTNPTFQHHYPKPVRDRRPTSRSASASLWAGDDSLSEGPNGERMPAGPSNRTTRATRGESNGRSLEPHRRESASGIRAT